MLSEADVTALQAIITTAETELSALQQQRRDSIEHARSINRKTNELSDKINAVQNSDALKAAKDKLTQHNAEVLKAKAEQSRKEAEAKAAARAQEASELAKKDAEIAALKEQLAAKG